ncbi:MAG: hypothetical protein M1820_006360 [Bogoriella megaspora]|nr:MAG: hypothetical protein M1820_006360 [Bogoriella megaspora]
MLDSVFNHIVLPPKLPGGEERNLDLTEQDLISRILDACRTIRDRLSPEEYAHWDSLRRSLESSKRVNSGRKINKDSLLFELRQMLDGDFLILHVTQQNAGILLEKQNHGTLFEAFEASALSENTITSQRALQWDFPGSSVVVPTTEMSKPAFQESLASFLAQASSESITQFAARSWKAGSFTPESRDTVDPALITQMLMSVLEVNGYRTNPPKLRKRVRDDVCWDNAEKPWRRSPMWLVLRVCLQRHLYGRFGSETGSACYKFILCLVHSQLLEDATRQSMHPEQIHLLKAKLCRRLVKLQVDEQRCIVGDEAVATRRNHRHIMLSSRTAGEIYADHRSSDDTLLDSLRTNFRLTISHSQRYIEAAWSQFRTKHTRPVQLLPKYATDRECYMLLPQSQNYLNQVLRVPLRSTGLQAMPTCATISSATTDSFRSFVELHTSLSALEAEASAFEYHPCATSPQRKCIEAASKIQNYLQKALATGAYNSDTEQRSMMLLTLMELWTVMDKYAVRSYPLLKDFSPPFPSNILDVLHVPLFKDMSRLYDVERYLVQRHIDCQSPGRSSLTIFDDPQKDCFAERVFLESEISQELLTLQRNIKSDAESEWQLKREEWHTKSAEHDRLTKLIAESTCIMGYDEVLACSFHDETSCIKCSFEREAKSLRIRKFERPLPEDASHARAVVFELACPEAFIAYRDATWRVVGELAYGKDSDLKPTKILPKIQLREYARLQHFNSSKSSSVSLASTAKSFMMTHFDGHPFPIDLQELQKENGLKYGYFDTITELWTGRLPGKPTFQHHCRLDIPKLSPFAALKLPDNVTQASNEPYSNDVIASQTKCPPGMNVQESFSYKSLLSGTYRRWPSMLAELGSSSLNFSSNAVALLFSHLALQAGPTGKWNEVHFQDHTSIGGFPEPRLRAVHAFFSTSTFCERFIELLEHRLEGISSNWRETHCMDMLITMILRLCSLVPLRDTANREKSTSLLIRAREISYGWLRQLRDGTLRTTDAESFQRLSRYLFKASLLCKRTFSMLVEKPKPLRPSALKCIFECSIVLQDNMVDDPETLPAGIKKSLVRDLKMMYHLRHLIRSSIKNHPQGLLDAIESLWAQAEGAEPRSYSDLQLDTPDTWWVCIAIQATANTHQQWLQYHIVEGHLLVDGRPLRKLPPDHLQSSAIRRLFGSQSLFTYPSPLPGMSYMLAVPMEGHQVHFGYRGGKSIVRVCFENSIMEYIPPEIFGNQYNFDLPLSLIEGHVHLLEITTGILHIRPQQHQWKHKSSNWQLDINTRSASRRSKSFLVDPQSSVFRRIANLFSRFEPAAYLEVFQPRIGPVRVHLRRMELSFFVNRSRLLESPELRQEIDPTQDIGCWHGLNSKLALRDMSNTANRSVLVPFGKIMLERSGIHIGADIVTGHADRVLYGRFEVNTALGRIECAAEPRLLYLKAYLHAITSFVVPDSLTGRTGTEEALSFLCSGCCQPWTPIAFKPHETLMEISSLAPSRQYYPPHLRRMQRVTWDPRLTVTVQHDALRPAVEAILATSEQLVKFAESTIGLAEITSLQYDAHLHSRGLSRRETFERRLTEPKPGEVIDVEYHARDQRVNNQRSLNVMSITAMLYRWRPNVTSAKDLAGILQGWPTIGGFDRVYDKVRISDQLTTDLAVEFGALARRCYESDQSNSPDLMFLFAALVFRNDVNLDVIRIVAAFAMLNDLKNLQLPKWSSYSFYRHRSVPRLAHLIQFVTPHGLAYIGDERQHLPFLAPKQRRKLEAVQEAYEKEVKDDCQEFTKFLIAQWPNAEPSIINFTRTSRIDIKAASKALLPEWTRLSQNFQLSGFVDKVQAILDQCRELPVLRQSQLPNGDGKVFPSRRRGMEVPSLAEDLLCRTYAEIQMGKPLTLDVKEIPKVVAKENMHPRAPKSTIAKESNQHRVSSEIRELEMIIESLTDPRSVVRQRYSKDLQGSVQKLKEFQKMSKPLKEIPSYQILVQRVIDAKKDVDNRFKIICQAFEYSDPCCEFLQAGGLWPCITPVTLLEQLRSTSCVKPNQSIKEGIIDYAVAVTHMQRLERIRDCLLNNNLDKAREELESPGHANWNPSEHLDWLLLEIDSNILIRPSQVEVAFATAAPASGTNSVLQMNMGQGKTSVVMPMVAALLANPSSRNLVRVCVPKALLLQTAQLLHARLGGLIGRELRHVPFSRRTPTTPDLIRSYYDTHRQLLRCSGIMVTLPEHMMSFRLSGLQRMSDGRMDEAAPMLKIQDWTTRHCRDVLDESDFTLAVRTQLIYPSGSQKTVDGFPHRWETAEALLKLVYNRLWNLQSEFPRSIEVVWRANGGFPVIYFLRRDAEDDLISGIVDDVCSTRTGILPLNECSIKEQRVIKRFISSARVSPDDVTSIRRVFPEKLSARRTVYHLRGLLVHRILLLTLKKRWNVQYGIHPLRDPIAVPYHAKGVPSEQAEWGHPDVAILFTCLAFYYGGLEVPQMRQCLETILKADDPFSEYDRWTRSCESLPDSLKDWNAINVDDEIQLAEIWQYLRNNIVVVDYFLNHLVFPKHAKQFPLKLQASGWDLPTVPSNDLSGPRTTGFSGTNDNRDMLPLTIKQSDLENLAHTNAEVLTYLLKPRSRGYQLAADQQGRFSELKLLRKIVDMEIRILIDAGAQILEMDNYNLVKQWLTVDTQAPAGLYFNEQNKAMVLYRNGLIVPFLASPFVDNLGNVLVYLDEAHTRGTDLKFPATAKGALTLGIGITKDALVQAAMRLRRLGTTQSVVFFASREVHQSIKDVRQKPYSMKVDSADVIRWLLEQTCDTIEQLQPLYFAQGADFCRRTQAAIDNADYVSDEYQREAYLDTIRQSEQQTLIQLYEPKQSSSASAFPESPSPRVAEYARELKARRKGFQDTGNAVHNSALQEVEQEREVAVEHENVREVQKPVHFDPLKFGGLHKDILNFARTGRLSAGSQAHVQAFVVLRRTALGSKHGIHERATRSKFYVSQEFTRTVRATLGRPNDNFQRPVNWILWSTVTETALVVNPEEAEILIPILREQKNPSTHLLVYAAPVTRTMLHFNRLRFLSIPDLPTDWMAPSWFLIELGIFAGRLYFEPNEYEELTQYLGLGSTMTEKQANGSAVDLSNEDQDVDGDVDGSENGANAQEDTEKSKMPAQVTSFTKKPLNFLQKWLAIRRKGQEFSQTPMGYICQGKQLLADHPFFESARDHRVNDSVSNGAVGLGGSNMINGGTSIKKANDEPEFDEDFDENEHEIGKVGNDDDDEFFDCPEEQNEIYNADYAANAES